MKPVIVNYEDAIVYSQALFSELVLPRFATALTATSKGLELLVDGDFEDTDGISIGSDLSLICLDWSASSGRSIPSSRASSW